jgi:hypothetical protein
MPGWRDADVTKRNWREPKEPTPEEEARRAAEQEEDEWVDAYMLGMAAAQEDHDPIDLREREK